MNAEYTTSLLYPGNPYVEALPPMLAGQELIRASSLDFSALPVWQVLASCPPLLLFGRSVQRRTIARCPLPVTQSCFTRCSPAQMEK